MQNGKAPVNGAKVAGPAGPVPPAAPEVPIKSDLQYLYDIEQGLRRVLNLIHEFHGGAVQFANRCAQLEGENAQLRAEVLKGVSDGR